MKTGGFAPTLQKYAFANTMMKKMSATHNVLLPWTGKHTSLAMMGVRVLSMIAQIYMMD